MLWFMETNERKSSKFDKQLWISSQLKFSQAVYYLLDLPLLCKIIEYTNEKKRYNAPTHIHQFGSVNYRLDQASVFPH